MKKNLQELDFLTTAQVASELRVTQRRVQALLKAGRLPGAQRFGHVWLIPRSALEAARVRKPGRPWDKKVAT